MKNERKSTVYKYYKLLEYLFSSVEKEQKKNPSILEMIWKYT